MSERRPITLQDGRYELRELLGEGGSSRVWLAWDAAVGRDVAIKRVHGEGRVLETRARRLAQEAAALRAVRHPGVVELYDHVPDAAPPFLVLEFLPGGTLEARQQRDKVVPAREAVVWMIDVLGALDVAHRRGVVHRDVKPSNILLDAAGRARLVDFGIALLHGELEPTRTDAGVGSIMFMAPEQRLDARSVGPQADVYAVASTLYHLITGATAVDLFAAGPTSGRWSDVPAPLRPVLLRATRHEPEERPASASALARALADAAVHLDDGRAPSRARRPGDAAARRAPSRSSWLAHSAALAGLVVASAGAVRAQVAPAGSTPAVADRASFSAVQGGWAGIVDAAYGRLVVEGSGDAVRAQLTSNLAAPGATRVLAGTFDAGTGVLVVEDAPAVGERYRLVLALEGGGRRLVGTAENLRTTQIRTVSLGREGESARPGPPERGTQGAVDEARSE